MNDTERSHLDSLIDLLADEVARRLVASAQPKPSEPVLLPPVPPAPGVLPAAKAEPIPPPKPADESVRESTPAVVPSLRLPGSSHAAPLMARLALGICLVVVLINIPLNAQGTAIARSIPNSASLVITNGLVVKEETSPDIWVYRDGAFHWITSLDAFEHYGYRWERVHSVEPGFLNAFDKGSPIYVLLKCDSSPHIYQLEAGQKRWIVDIPTFQAQGYIWQDVRFVPCAYLRGLPDGESIPPGRGTPPPPLP
jgi:hypothetical protein